VNYLRTKLIFLIALACLTVLAFQGFFSWDPSWWDGR
jgi:hypothetical protein